MIDVDCQVESVRKLTLTLHSEDEDIGVVEMIRALAHFIQHHIQKHNLKPEDLAIKPGDQRREL